MDLRERYSRKFLEKLELLYELIFENQEKYDGFSTESGNDEDLFTEEEALVFDLYQHVSENGLNGMDVEGQITNLNRIYREQMNIKENGIDAHNPVWKDVDEILKNGGNKIKAIKRYREITGEGLRESKNAVDERQRLLGL
jgi:hypothetical protein